MGVEHVDIGRAAGEERTGSASQETAPELLQLGISLPDVRVVEIVLDSSIALDPGPDLDVAGDRGPWGGLSAHAKAELVAKEAAANPHRVDRTLVRLIGAGGALFGRHTPATTQRVVEDNPGGPIGSVGVVRAALAVHPAKKVADPPIGVYLPVVALGQDLFGELPEYVSGTSLWGVPRSRLLLVSCAARRQWA